MLTLHTRRLLAVLALTFVSFGGATNAFARAAKPAGPTLTIESKTCNTGADAGDRFIVLTASAVLRGVGDEVQMRFSVQQRAAIKTSWRTVFAKTGDLGTWATSDAGADGLRYTKTINGLAEGTQYRVVVDARGVDGSGTVRTKTTRKTVVCVQPQLTARLIMRAGAIVQRPAKGLVVRATIQNAGSQASGSATVTARDAETQTLLGQHAVPAVAGNATAIVPVELTSCPGKLIITVQDDGAAPTALAPEQSLTIDCATLSDVETLSRR